MKYKCERLRDSSAASSRPQVFVTVTTDGAAVLLPTIASVATISRCPKMFTFTTSSGCRRLFEHRRLSGLHERQRRGIRKSICARRMRILEGRSAGMFYCVLLRLLTQRRSVAHLFVSLSEFTRVQSSVRGSSWRAGIVVARSWLLHSPD